MSSSAFSDAKTWYYINLGEGEGGVSSLTYKENGRYAAHGLMADGTADGPASGVVQVQLLLLRVAELSAGKPYRNTLTRSPEVWKKNPKRLSA
jgi:hypothetical protein